jgi:glycerate 2-kinase
VVVNSGFSCRLRRIKVTEAGHPAPDLNGFKATEAILEIVDKSTQDDLVICLISGGGSSLLADLPAGASASDMSVINNLLVNCGASIAEINCVRKHLSYVKGGQLARRIYPAKLISLLLSDVPGDPPDVIASGPTTPDPTTFRQAYSVVESYGLTASCPEIISQHLRKGMEGKIVETPKPSDIIFRKALNVIIGSNTVALQAAGSQALEFNINPVIVDNRLQGDISFVAEYIVSKALGFQSDEKEIKPVCLLFGGEVTIKMTGKGKGGRDQHLALLCSLLLRDHPGITLLAAGTDGNDGPTNAAGAVVDSTTFSNAGLKRIDPEQYLSDFNSYSFFKKAGGHIITGPTMTNVMDIIIIIVE